MSSAGKASAAHPGWPRSLAGLVCALGLVLSLLLLPLVCAASARADSSSEYGEVERFGGFDSSAYNSGHYGGPLTSGKLLDPTGFAVDAEEGNTVYVVDRTSSYEQEPTSSWRIQKFSPTGAVLGTTTFTLPNTSFDASAVVGLAVDHRAGRLYALVIGSPPLTSPYPHVTMAQEIVAWSTEPNASKELVAAAGLQSESSLGGEALGTTGGVVSTQKELQAPGATPLYYPQGIVIDRLEATGVDNPVAIEATDLSPTGSGNGIPGDTVVQQIATQPQQGKEVGALLSSWSSESVAETLNGSWGPLGISDDPDGTISVLLEASNLSATDAYVVKLNPDLSDPLVLNSDAVEPPLGGSGKGSDLDQAAMWLNGPPVHTVAGVTVSNTSGAGAELMQLSTAASNSADGLYAADIFFTVPADVQNHGGSEYWSEGSTPVNYVSNIGTRLLQPTATGEIASPTGGTIVNTLGNGTAGGPCNIGAPEAALAAGANGTLWVLDRGPTSKIYDPSSPFNWTGVGVGRQIIEFAPGAGELCPQPTGTFTMEPAGGTSQSAESQLEIPAGTKVTFDASSLRLKGGKPFAYEWDLDGNPHNGASGEGFETVNRMQAPFYYVPTETASYTYARPGTYEVRLQVRSDYGTYTTSGKVIVTGQAVSGPHAQFAVVSSSGSQQVTVNAAGSTPGGGSIAYYIWNWGDGDVEEESPQSPIASHVYANPGTYQITLTVVSNSFLSAISPPQTVTIEASRPAPQAPLIGALYEIPIPASPPAAPTPKPPSPNVSPHASYIGGVVDVHLSCPKTSSSCLGTVRVQTAHAVAASKSGRKRHGASAKRLQLGRASFSLASGVSRVIAVRVSAQGLALLRKLKRLPALVIVAAHDSSGDPGTRTLPLTLTVPAGVHGRDGSRKRR